MNDRQPVRIRVTGPGEMLAVLPRMLGYVPADSLVVVGLSEPRGQVGLVFRYDLPPMEQMPEVIEHATSILARENMNHAVVVGYGTGPQITPRTDAFRQGAAAAGLDLKDVLRVDEGRYWSYLCTEPSCHPAEGTPLEAERPADAVLNTVGPVLADRQALAATIAPLTGSQDTLMKQAGQRAERAARELADRGGPQAVYQAGLDAVQSAVSTYRGGGTIGDDQHAWLAHSLTDIRVRDSAWARMDPKHAKAHSRLWADLVRRAQPGHVAAPASLLAFTAAQDGQGALANVALDRATGDDPGYSMAHLLGQAFRAGVHPRELTPPMTPEEVAAAYEPTPDAAQAVAGQSLRAGTPRPAEDPESGEQAGRKNADHQTFREAGAENASLAIPAQTDVNAETDRSQHQPGLREIGNPPTDPLPRVLADHHVNPVLAPVAATLPDGTPHSDPYLAARGWQAQGGVYVRQPQAEIEAG